MTFSWAWELNELSILFPLPKENEREFLWEPKDNTGKGNLLPSLIYQELPLIVIGKEKDWIYQNLRVVGLRIDPCFQDDKWSCARQIRIVWQPIEKVAEKFSSKISKKSSQRIFWSTLDASVHSFYQLNESQWQEFRSKLMKFVQLFPMEKDLPLGIHPILKREGMNSVFAKRLKTLILGALRSDQIIRTTVMTVNREGTVWVFTGFDWKDGISSRMSIPRVDKTGQAFFANLEEPIEYRSQMNPFPENETSFLNFLFDSKNWNQIPRPELEWAVRSAWKNLNPNLTNPGNRDCVSCHVSRSIPLWFEKNVSNDPSPFRDLIFEGPGNLANTSVNPMRSQILRAFGYFGRDPIVSPRVVYETSLATLSMDKKP